MPRAAVQLQTGGPLEIVEVAVRPPGPGEVRVAMAAAGLCHTDVQALSGGLAGTVLPPPLVAGHEGAGIVTEVGDGVTDLAVGDHVIIAVRAHDGSCAFCLDGHPALCRRTYELADPRNGNGPVLFHDSRPVTTLGPASTFTEEIVVRTELAIRIDAAIPLDLACLIGCAVSTGVGAVRNTVGVQAGEHTVVIGCGGVGLNIVQAARLAKAASVIAVDVNETKLATATAFGATHTVDARTADILTSVREATDGLGAHYAFESTGLVDSMSQAVSLIRPGGTAVILGMAPSSTPLVIDNIAAVILQEKSITGSMMGSGAPSRDFPQLVSQYLDGDLKLEELVTRRRPLAEINEAITDLEAGNGLRTVFTF